VTTSTQQPGAESLDDAYVEALAASEADRQSRRSLRTKSALFDASQRGLLSPMEWRQRRIRRWMRVINVGLLSLLLLAGLGPLLWLAKSAITPTQDTLKTPMAWFPNGIDVDNLWQAWFEVDISQQFMNTIYLAAGSWVVQMLVATTAGFALGVLKPRYGKVFYWMVLATLFVPAVVLLVPLYLTILNPPIIGTSLINTFWAVWLPAGASAFNVVLVTRFMGNLPGEIFEAARMDGAGTFRMFWSIALPMSKPIIGVVSVFAVLAAWKDFLWPLLVLPNPDLQPLSVRLPTLQQAIETDVYLAALAISTVIPIALFIVFQRLILRSAGLGGALKG
jgi:multiple sugar transport system permease protein